MSDQWTEKEGTLTRAFTFGKYMDGVEFARKVALTAEKLNHHPDILIGYRRVIITTTTHDAGNVVTRKDRELASEIDDIPSSI